MLVGAEIGGRIIERQAGALDHPFEIGIMARVVVEVDRHILPALVAHFVARRLHGVRAQHGRLHLVVEIAAAVLQPFALKGAGGDDDLVRAGADDGVEIDPVGVVGNVAAGRAARIGGGQHRCARAQLVAFAVALVAQFGLRLVADAR